MHIVDIDAQCLGAGIGDAEEHGAHEQERNQVEKPEPLAAGDRGHGERDEHDGRGDSRGGVEHSAAESVICKCIQIVGNDEQSCIGKEDENGGSHRAVLGAFCGKEGDDHQDEGKHDGNAQQDDAHKQCEFKDVTERKQIMEERSDVREHALVICIDIAEQGIREEVFPDEEWLENA